MEKGRNIFSEVKSRITCIGVAALCGIHLDSGGRGKSFRPGSTNTSSLHVYEKGYTDYGDPSADGSGDQIAFYQRVKGIERPIDAAIELAHHIGIDTVQGDFKVSRIDKSKEILVETINFWHENLSKSDRKYLNDRSISDETIEKYKIGSSVSPVRYLEEKGFKGEAICDSGVLGNDDRIIFPYFNNGRPEYFIGRTMIGAKAKYKKMKQTGVNEHVVWGIDELRKAKPEGEIFVAEGIMDALSADQAGYKVITPVTANFSKSQQEEIISIIRRKSLNVTICLDYDPESQAGQKGAERMAHEMFKYGVNATILTLKPKDPTKKTDLNEQAQSSTELPTILAGSDKEKQSSAEIANLGQNKKKIAGFMRRVHLSFDEMERDSIYDELQLKGGFSGRLWVNAIKTATRKKTEYEMVDEIKQEHDLKFDQIEGKMLEYNGMYWKQLDNSEIRDIVFKVLGKEATSNSVKSLKVMLEESTMVSTEEALEFNTQEKILVTKNGTVDLESGALVDPKREHKVSKIVETKVLRGKRCEKWMQFLRDITAQDESRIKVLQEIFGYSLLRTAKYQQCYMLIGAGSNGKSIFTKILRKMLGQKNVSNLMLSQVGERFLKINLRGVMANIAEETLEHGGGDSASANLKSMVTGDTIVGEYKGKDAVEFSPTATMIFCMNRLPAIKDPDGGFLRRLNFVEFEVHFKEKVRPDEDSMFYKVVDSGLLKELEKELEGILLWAIEGAGRIIKNKKLTKCEDTEKMVARIVERGSSVESFIIDRLKLTDVIDAPTKELYQEYRREMEEQGFSRQDIKRLDDFKSVCKNDNTLKGFRSKTKKGGGRIEITKC